MSKKKHKNIPAAVPGEGPVQQPETDKLTGRSAPEETAAKTEPAAETPAPISGPAAGGEPAAPEEKNGKENRTPAEEPTRILSRTGENEQPVDLEITRTISLVMEDRDKPMPEPDPDEPQPVRKNLDEFDFTGTAEKAINAELEPSAKMRRQRREKWLRGLMVAFGILMLSLIIGAGGVLYGLTYHYDGIYPGVRLWDVSLSQLSYDETRDKLEDTFASRPLTGTMKITVEDQVLEVSMQDAAAHYDLETTLEAAWKVGRTGSLRQRLWAIYGAMSEGVELLPDILYDTETLAQAVRQIVAPVEQELIQPTYTVGKGMVALDRGQTGVRVDSEALTRLVYSKMQNLDFSDVEFAAEKTEPRPQDLMAIKKDVDLAPVEPVLDLKADPSGKTLIPGKVGYSFDVAQARSLLDRASSRVVILPVEILQPKISDQEFLAGLFRDELAVYSSKYNVNLVGRTTNVELAASFINGTIVNPFETFSYNKTVGPRTYERGFKDATVFNNGTTEDGVGGGICQVSSTIYAAVLRTDLLVSERRNHTYKVNYVPMGEDATVVYGSQDFAFINPFDYPVKLELTCSNGELTVRILGTRTDPNAPIIEIEDETVSTTPFKIVYKLDKTLAPGTEKIRNKGYNGYKVDSYRVEKDPKTGEVLKREYLGRSNYSPMTKTYLYNPLDPDNDPHAVPNNAAPRMIESNPGAGGQE